MAKPPRFQKRRSRPSGFVDSVRETIKQVQQELEEASQETREAYQDFQQDVAKARESARRVAGKVPDLADRARSEMSQRRQEALRKQALKKKLQAALNERARKPERNAATPPRRRQPTSLEGTSMEGQALEGENLEGPTLEGISSEGATLEGISSEGVSLEGISLEETDGGDELGLDSAAPVAPSATGTQIRRLLRSRASLRQAIMLHEILGPPKSQRS